MRLISSSSLVCDIVEFCLTIQADSVDWSVDFLLRMRSRFTGTRLGEEVDDEGDVRPELELRAWNDSEEDMDDLGLWFDVEDVRVESHERFRLSLLSSKVGLGLSFLRNKDAVPFGLP